MHTREQIRAIQERQNSKALEAPSTKAFAAQKEILPLCETVLELLRQVEQLTPHHVPGLLQSIAAREVREWNDELIEKQHENTSHTPFQASAS